VAEWLSRTGEIFDVHGEREGVVIKTSRVGENHGLSKGGERRKEKEKK
jgi:hypothetical protein